MIFSDNQKDIWCDFEDSGCDSIFIHNHMLHTEVNNMRRTVKSSAPKSDHTFGQGIDTSCVCTYNHRSYATM